MYSCDCNTCKSKTLHLNAKGKPFSLVVQAFEKAFKKLYRQKSYTVTDLFEIPEYKDAIQTTYQIFNATIEDSVVEGELLRKLQEDIFLFSGLKTHTQLFEASRLLLDENGKIKPEHLFKKEFKKINATYNENYLEAEYAFATASAQQADRWSKIDPQYYLQYRTAADDRVRDSHRALHNITLAASDPFWDSFYPPNGWRCRCIAVEVLPTKYTTNDSKEAILKGNIATTQIDKNHKNKLAIFRFNPGKEKVIFPPDHPYHKVKGASKLKKKITSASKTLKSNKEVSDYFKHFAIQYPEYFANGYDKVEVTRKRGVNGYTTLRGDIYLTASVMKNVKAGLNAIIKKEKTTKDQEIAISTLHHEIMHNAHTKPLNRLTSSQVRYMELANEFVSRKELPIFMKRLGGKLEHKELTSNRENTGYNTMVRNFDRLISITKSDPIEVLKDVKDHLLNQPYSTQLEGLTNAIANNTPIKVKKENIKVLVQLAINKTETSYEAIFNEKSKLFKTERK